MSWFYGYRNPRPWRKVKTFLSIWEPKQYENVNIGMQTLHVNKSVIIECILLCFPEICLQLSCYSVGLCTTKTTSVSKQFKGQNITSEYVNWSVLVVDELGRGILQVDDSFVCFRDWYRGGWLMWLHQKVEEKMTPTTLVIETWNRLSSPIK